MLLVPQSALAAPDPYLVRDINLGSDTSYADHFIELNGSLYFFAVDGSNGGELWRSDGTEAGTTLVKDINPGAGYGLYPNLEIAKFNGALYFRATDGTPGGSGLWKSDGSAAGTVLVQANTNPTGEFEEFGGELFFSGARGVSGDELWKTDGTDGGTELVKDIYTLGTGGSFPRGLTVVGGTLFFSASDSTSDSNSGVELWKSDGTEGGTELVEDINPGTGHSSPRDLINLDGTLLFTADDGTDGRELWKSGGTTATTELVEDINGSGNSIQATADQGLIKFGGLVFFAANDGVNGEEVWSSDGTAGNTDLVKNINGSGGGSSYPYSFTESNGTLFFGATDDGAGNVELWKTNGTEGGTELVKEIRSGAFGSYPFWLTDVDGTLFFNADGGINSNQLWKSDGTGVGTTLATANPGVAADPSELFDFGGTLFLKAYFDTTGLELGAFEEVAPAEPTFTGSDPVSSANANSPTISGLAEDGSTVDLYATVDCTGPPEATGRALEFESPGFDVGVADDSTTTFRATSTDRSGNVSPCSADSLIYTEDSSLDPPAVTPPDPYLLRDINPAGDSNATRFTDVGGILYFTADDGSNGQELWKSDGTEAGTVMVKDINEAGDSAPEGLTEAGGDLFFSADDGSNGRELWKSDGTASGTKIVKNLNGAADTYVLEFTAVGDTLFYSADDGSTGQELWMSDGTEAGTEMVRDINAAGDSSPGRLVAFDGALFFNADNGSDGKELWTSDGTELGTTQVKDINPGGDSDPVPVVSNGALFFGADDGTNGRELWKSDGTTGGTELLKDINVGGASGPRLLEDIGGRLVFAASDGIHGQEPWTSDGTPGGTQLLKDIEAGVGSSGPMSFAEFGGAILFEARDGVHGYEFWKSDGTEAGTTLVRDILPGKYGSQPGGYTELDGTVFFRAWDFDRGQELWSSDGTTAGTRPVEDIWPGPDSGFASPSIARSAGNIFLGADDGSSGVELWILDLTAPAKPGFDVPVSPANDNNPQITGSAEAGSTVRLYPTSDCSGPPAAIGSAGEFGGAGLAVNVTDDSTSTFHATSTDFGGNKSACSTGSATFVEDSTAPEATITSGPSGTTGDATPTFGFSSSEPGSSFECRVDSDDFASCSSPETVAALSAGPHSFEVRATDSVGNIDQTPATRTFTVDTTPPDTTINAGPTGTITTNQATFTFAGDPASDTAKIQCRIDNEPFTDCHLPQDLHRPERRPLHRHLPRRGRSRKPGPVSGQPRLHSRHDRLQSQDRQSEGQRPREGQEEEEGALQGRHLQLRQRCRDRRTPEGQRPGPQLQHINWCDSGRHHQDRQGQGQAEEARQDQGHLQGDFRERRRQDREEDDQGQEVTVARRRASPPLQPREGTPGTDWLEEICDLATDPE